MQFNPITSPTGYATNQTYTLNDSYLGISDQPNPIPLAVTKSTITANANTNAYTNTSTNTNTNASENTNENPNRTNTNDTAAAAVNAITTAAATATPKNEKPKRKQVKNACVNCQKACKKCDDGRPCQRCLKLGLTLTCSNSERKERKKGMKRGPYKKRQRQTSSSSISYDQGSYMANEWYPNHGYTAPSCAVPIAREAQKREPTLWLEEQQHQVYPTLSTEESALVHAFPMLDTGYIQASTTPSLAQSSPLSSPHSGDEAYQIYPGSTSPISLVFSQGQSDFCAATQPPATATTTTTTTTTSAAAGADSGAITSTTATTGTIVGVEVTPNENWWMPATTTTDQTTKTAKTTKTTTITTTPYLVQPTTESTPGFVPSYSLGPISPVINGVTFELPISLPVTSYQDNIIITQPMYYSHQQQPQNYLQQQQQQNYQHPVKEIMPCIDVPSQSWLDQLIQPIQQLQQPQNYYQIQQNNFYQQQLMQQQQQQQQQQKHQQNTWQSSMGTRF
ncbi:hypothetical protein J3Q64DRAFT_1707487 [Phycomyces blakesleeanus]|uniref:Zn(2)-C6 fungal-type domain-containing protein n=1 Tax=Phycomyces blakesleeanus TaxID=4837 RepID=A0ABR3BC84_PHYBL